MEKMIKYDHSDVKVNVYENVLSSADAISTVGQNLLSKKPVSMSIESLSNLSPENRQKNLNKNNEYENHSTVHEAKKAIENKNSILRKPVPSPKPLLNKNIKSIATDPSLCNNNLLTSKDKTNAEKKDVIYSLPIKTDINGNILKKDSVMIDSQIEPIEFNNFPTIRNSFSMFENHVNDKNSDYELIDNVNNDIVNNDVPILYEKELQTDSRIRNKSKNDDYEDIDGVNMRNNYYNMSKKLFSLTSYKPKEHVYETVDELNFKPSMLTTSISLDSPSQSDKKKTFRFKIGKSISDCKPEKQHNPVFSKLDIISEFIKSDSDFIEVLSMLLKYEDILVFHKQFLDKFTELFKIVKELQGHHKNFIDRLNNSISNKGDGEIIIGGNIKEFALYDYKCNKDYLVCLNEILPSIKNCDTECQVLCYFSSDLKQFSKLLDLLMRPINQLQKTISFFNELKNSNKVAEDEHEINQILSIASEFITDIPDLRFSDSLPIRASHVIENCKNEKKASYIVLYPDVVACQRLYSSKKGKFSWVLPITGISKNEIEKCALRTHKRQKELSELQSLIKQNNEEDNLHKKLNLQQKRLEKIDAQILTQLSILPLILSDKTTNTNHALLFSSNYDRIMWQREVDNCRKMRSNIASQDYNDQRLSKHIASASVKTIMSETMEFISGNLSLTLISIVGAISDPNLDFYVDIELDYYGYFLCYATTKKSMSQSWNENFKFDFDGAEHLFLIVYKSDEEPVGQAIIQLSSLNMGDVNMDVKLSNSWKLKICVNFTPKKFMTRRIEPKSVCGIFGSHLNETRNNEEGIPIFVVDCVTEIESRGLREPGLYRISGLSKNVQKIRSLFDKNHYDQVISKIKLEDVNLVASLLKVFFHSLPESIFTDDRYKLFVDAYAITDKVQRQKKLAEEFNKLPKKKKVPTATLR